MAWIVLRLKRKIKGEGLYAPKDCIRLFLCFFFTQNWWPNNMHISMPLKPIWTEQNKFAFFSIVFLLTDVAKCKFKIPTSNKGRNNPVTVINTKVSLPPPIELSMISILIYLIYFTLLWFNLFLLLIHPSLNVHFKHCTLMSMQLYKALVKR